MFFRSCCFPWVVAYMAANCLHGLAGEQCLLCNLLGGQIPEVFRDRISIIVGERAIYLMSEFVNIPRNVV